MQAERALLPESLFFRDKLDQFRDCLSAMPSTLSMSATLQAVPGVLQSDVGDGIVLLHLRSNSYFGLNTVGATVWQLLQEPQSVPELIDELLARFDVTPERCRTEVMDVLTRLHAADLVRICDVAGS